MKFLITRIRILGYSDFSRFSLQLQISMKKMIVSYEEAKAKVEVKKLEHQIVKGLKHV